MILLDAFTFLGRLHPLVVHLPVGFLLLAVIFQLLSFKKEHAHLKQAVSFTLLVGFISAALASIFGYMLSFSGDYDIETLRNHKISGIIISVISFVLWLFSRGKIYRVSPGLFSVLLAGLALMLGYAGHQGGSLTHGNEYISLDVLTRQERSKPTNLNETYIFEDVIHPLLMLRCGQCHSGGKKKGRLTMEKLADLLKGGKSGPAIVPGRSSESELFERITLDENHEKFMPSDGKIPLKRSEVQIIKWWIDQADAVQGKKLLDIKNSDSIASKVAAFLGFKHEKVPDFQNARVNSEIPDSLDITVLDTLRKKGIMVRLMQHQPPMLDVTIPSDHSINIDHVRDDLIRVSKNVVWLNVSGNNLPIKQLAFLSEFANVEKLRLENNPVSDSILPLLRSLKHLEAVNLNNTGVTEAGIDKLKKSSTIKRIYYWNSLKAVLK